MWRVEIFIINTLGLKPHGEYETREEARDIAKQIAREGFWSDETDRLYAPGGIKYISIINVDIEKAVQADRERRGQVVRILPDKKKHWWEL